MNATAPEVDPEVIVRFLSNPLTYADGPDTVETIETHISRVFLTPRYVYKLKKPVQFEFLDFSTVELRHHACLEELRLNRRLAPGVYLDVVPITRDTAGRLMLGGTGAPIDWVVQMRRLPADRALDVLLKQHQVTEDAASRIADYLAKFYAGLAPEPANGNEYCTALGRHIRANMDALLTELPAERDRIERIRGAQLRFLALESDLFDVRAKEGRLVDGHGDLRPEHIYLEDHPAVIDCVEFSDELRKVDVVDELGFFAMECEQLGAAQFGNRVLAEYRRRFLDDFPAALLMFYQSYRACVRTKVTLLRADQAMNATRASLMRSVRSYLGWADKYVAALGRPCLVVFSGLMGSGKSTLAAVLAETIAARRLSTDTIRRLLLGASETPASYGEGKYEPGVRQGVYEELLRQGGEVLRRGQSVVLDGAFLTHALRTQARELGARGGAVTLFVHCECPREAALYRIQGRARAANDTSEARPELYDLQAREFEPLWDEGPAITVDTTHEMSHQLNAIYGELRYLLL